MGGGEDHYMAHMTKRLSCNNLHLGDPSNKILSQFYAAYQMLETLEERR